MQDDRLTENMLTTKMKTSWNGTDVLEKLEFLNGINAQKKDFN